MSITNNESQQIITTDMVSFLLTLGNDNDYPQVNFLNSGGGKNVQKGGSRLETAVVNSMPNIIKKNIYTNIKIKSNAGNLLGEYDILYCCGNEVISFEIKGINGMICNQYNRNEKLLEQGMRQKQILKTFFPKGYFISNVFCMVTGYVSSDKKINEKLINLLKLNGIIVIIGTTPKMVMNNAINHLHRIGYFKNIKI